MHGTLKSVGQRRQGKKRTGKGERGQRRPGKKRKGKGERGGVELRLRRKRKRRGKGERGGVELRLRRKRERETFPLLRALKHFLISRGVG